ncbi:hypothetical protein MZ16F91_07630 [Escherichia coli]
MLVFPEAETLSIFAGNGIGKVITPVETPSDIDLTIVCMIFPLGNLNQPGPLEKALMSGI